MIDNSSSLRSPNKNNNSVLYFGKTDRIKTKKRLVLQKKEKKGIKKKTNYNYLRSSQ